MQRCPSATKHVHALTDLPSAGDENTRETRVSVELTIGYFLLPSTVFSFRINGHVHVYVHNQSAGETPDLVLKVEAVNSSEMWLSWHRSAIGIH